MVADIFDHGVARCILEHFEPGTKLVEKVSVMRMQSMKKEHDEKDLGKHDLAMQHFITIVEQRTKLHIWLRLALDIVEEGHEGCKSICDGMRMIVLMKHHKHLKPLS
jgi:hypothetical protein